MKLHSWRRVRGRLIRSDSHQSSDSSVEMSDELVPTLASIQEFMVGVSRRLDQIKSSRQDPHPVGMVTEETIHHASQTAHALPPGVSLGTPYHLADHYETIPLPTVIVPPPIDRGLTWDDRDGIPAASLPAKFRIPDIERYSGIGCPKIHLRLYNTVMRVHRIDDAQLVALFPMSHSRTAQRCADIDVSRRELEAIRQRSNEFIFSFVNRWRAKVVDTTPSPDNKGKKPIRSFSRSGEVGAISYHHQRPTHHSPYRPLTVKAHFSHPQYQYQPVYVQEPYIAQTSMQPRPLHLRAATHSPPRPYAQRPAR
ncbi:hypothetical protein CK203_044512 [Vitis vinifera]|uniref:Retrotransposon gag domain-containing protein n=1 Tax=Vitis vinifera TaxID=29760 RepID=A0A438HB73_VITVI|nr:hypothetical protein CK203_044512 [Vitis vinifera]